MARIRPQRGCRANLWPTLMICPFPALRRLAATFWKLDSTTHARTTGSSCRARHRRQTPSPPRAAGEYQLLFGGVVGGAVLPNGTYTLRVEAVPVAGGAPVAQVRSVTLRDSDTRLPEIQNFTVFPDHFTPNRDGVDDRVSIS